MKNIDTIVQHVTNPSDNIFLDLGFAPEEAERCLAASRRIIEEKLNVKKRIDDASETHNQLLSE